MVKSNNTIDNTIVFCIVCRRDLGGNYPQNFLEKT